MAHHPELARAFSLSNAGRNPEAILIINQLVAREDAGALATLAEMKWRGGMVPQDPRAGYDLYRRASAAGEPGAAITFTNLLASGVAGPRDWQEALARLTDEAKRDPRRRAALQLIERMRLTEEGDPTTVPAGELLSESPHVTLFPRLFSAAECDFLKQLAEKSYEPSTVYDSTGRLQRDKMRTSDGSTIHWLIEDPAVHALNRRLAAISGSDAGQGEALQILRYKPGQQYRSHFDFVRAEENRRFRTALVYLNHDYKGGETCFVKTGLKVRAKKGDGVLFRNALADRSLDPMSEHAGLPVTQGVKFLASRWIRESRWAP